MSEAMSEAMHNFRQHLTEMTQQPQQHAQSWAGVIALLIFVCPILKFIVSLVMMLTNVTVSAYETLHWVLLWVNTIVDAVSQHPFIAFVILIVVVKYFRDKAEAAQTQQEEAAQTQQAEAAQTRLPEAAPPPQLLRMQRPRRVYNTEQRY
jgi:uncharacterized membrane protein